MQVLGFGVQALLFSCRFGADASAWGCRACIRETLQERDKIWLEIQAGIRAACSPAADTWQTLVEQTRERPGGRRGIQGGWASQSSRLESLVLQDPTDAMGRPITSQPLRNT